MQTHAHAHTHAYAHTHIHAHTFAIRLVLKQHVAALDQFFHSVP